MFWHCLGAVANFWDDAATGDAVLELDFVAAAAETVVAASAKTFLALTQVKA